ncbi:hypothetical protein DP067_01960 [Mycoplasmopsis anatis]|uniref:Uncharacterized protein n=1 Tax=Mycoplasmopsis anatis 1340 TaxID=1034808 RepID=F9QEN4_9BACT|nr:hypothetical protein [Mycoplasmopsis anatis]AWX70121.1 hypothetical protein DP067_01960 [Mycoplasmopsis anatis]EGS28797.1 hypothetical protein GIG_00555 [Mycoplasmopsis anatis 1340]VEU73438.1 Uncharacterised protein [Mycoplasmopsis anatis]
MTKYKKEIDFLSFQISKYLLTNSRQPSAFKTYEINGKNFLEKLIIFQDKFRWKSVSETINNSISSIRLNVKNKHKNKYLIISKDMYIFSEFIYILNANLTKSYEFYGVNLKSIFSDNDKSSIKNIKKLIDEIKIANADKPIIVLLENFNKINIYDKEIMNYLKNELNSLGKNILLIFSSYDTSTFESHYIPYIDQVIDLNNLPRKELINWNLENVYKLANGYKFSEENWSNIVKIVNGVKNMSSPTESIKIIKNCLNELIQLDNLTKNKYEKEFIKLFKTEINKRK